MNIRDYTGKELEHNGKYYLAPGTEEISYPSRGNEEFFAREDTSFWFSHRNRCIQAMVSRFRPAPPFFDIGGGNGVVSRHLGEHGLEVVLVEPGRDGAENAHARGLRNIINGTVASAGIRDGVIPSAGLFDVLEHVEDDAGFLKDLSGKMRPGGILMLTVPASPLLWSGEDVGAGHFRRYTREGLLGLLEAVGFQVVHDTFLFSFLPPFIFLFRRLLSPRSPGRSADTTLAPHSPHALTRLALAPFLALERFLVRHARLPFGSSLMAVCRKR